VRCDARLHQTKGLPARERGARSAHDANATTLGACPSNINTLLVGRLRRQKNQAISQILRAERAY
jgi:hypothetical protein